MEVSGQARGVILIKKGIAGMPFVAKDVNTGERIDITKIVQPRLALKSVDIICPLCEQPMIIKAGFIVRAHFAHKVTCTSDYRVHPESAEHLAAKEFIAGKLLDEFAGEYMQGQIEYEVPIPEIRRVADVLVSFPNGWRIAHEAQLASITTEELEERTNDYARAGTDVVWWLGEKANTSANRDWCLRRFGFFLYIGFGTRTGDWDSVL